MNVKTVSTYRKRSCFNPLRMTCKSWSDSKLRLSELSEVNDEIVYYYCKINVVIHLNSFFCEKNVRNCLHRKKVYTVDDYK